MFTTVIFKLIDLIIELVIKKNKREDKKNIITPLNSSVSYIDLIREDLNLSPCRLTKRCMNSRRENIFNCPEYTKCSNHINVLRTITKN